MNGSRGDVRGKPGSGIVAAWAFPTIALALAAIPFQAPAPLTDVFLFQQDLPVLCVCALFWAAIWLWLRGARDIAIAAPKWAPAAIAVSMFAVAAIGARVVFSQYGLSMDENMALFDAEIIRGGHLLASPPPAWRPYLDALQPIFLFRTGDGSHWSSAYLPVNAALLSVGARLGQPTLMTALLAAVSVIAVWVLARRLWPDRRDAALVAVVLMASSSQFLLMAMTPYAMTAHLAFNLVWLCLFLRGGRLGHVAAATVAVLACGLHQVVFHPIFAAPFVLQLWLQRRWKVAALHTAVYACAGLFWISYFSLVARDAGPMAAGSFTGRIMDLLAGIQPIGLAVMAKNLVRFIAWQNPVALALLVYGSASAWKAGGTLRCLLAGSALMVITMLVILPFQGHGWGYRYVHGYLGSLSLIATAGFLQLLTRYPGIAGGKLVVAGVAFSVGVLIPWHAIQAHRWVAPYTRAITAIQATDADVVLVDPRDIWFGLDLVRNDPNLRMRPKVMSIGDLDEDGIDALCAANTVAIFDKQDAARAGLRIAESTGEAVADARRMRAYVDSIGCAQAGAQRMAISKRLGNTAAITPAR